jgi:hypothetical protein
VIGQPPQHGVALAPGDGQQLAPPLPGNVGILDDVAVGVVAGDFA